MQGLVQISKIFGISLGYSINSIFGNRRWNFAFLLESILVTIVTFIMYLIPNDYYDKGYIDMERENKIDVGVEEKIEKETIFKDIFLNVPFILLQFYRGKILFINQTVKFLFYNQIDSAVFINEKNLIYHSYIFNKIFSSFLGIISGSLILIIIGTQYRKFSFLCIFYLQLIACFLFFLSNKYNSVIMICTYNYFNSACEIISLNISFLLMPKTLKATASGILSIIIISLGVLPEFNGYKLIKNFVGESGIINVLMLYGMIGCFELADFYMKINKSKLYQKY